MHIIINGQLVLGPYIIITNAYTNSRTQYTHILSYIHTKLLYNTQYGRANGTIATLPVMCSVANDLLLLVARFASD